MTKRQLIDKIVSINKSAPAAFLAGFDDGELNEYLEHLEFVQEPKPSVDTAKYDACFQQSQPVAADKQDITADQAAPQPLPLFKAHSSDRPDVTSNKLSPVLPGEVPQPAIAGIDSANSQTVVDDESEAWLY